MALTLAIENESRLADGGPLSIRVTGRRGIDIGRDQHLDWTLPDPSRAISGKHAEVRYQDGGYWLYDVSTNGTFLNGSDRRMQGPHRLRQGDRIDIGQYIISVSLEGEEAREPQKDFVTPPSDQQEFWGGVGGAAPPIAPKELLPPRQLRPVRPDFLDWAVDTPHDFPRDVPPPAPAPPPPMREAPNPYEDLSWAQGPAPRPPAADPTPPLPTPRRPGAAPPPDAGNPWGTPSLAVPAAEPRFSPEPAPAPRFPPEPPAPPRLPPEPAVAPVTVLEPQPPPAPAAHPAANRADPAGAADFVRRLARGAGVSEEVFARRDPGELAEELGALVRLVVSDLKQLLNARAESKRLARSSSQTMIQALDNNPLKFSPTAEDALRIMFGPPSSGYLDARRALEQSFKDLKVHQVKTYSAMQHALRMLVEDLDPKAIDEDLGGDRGLGALIGSRKARLWDAYVTRWDAKTAPHEDGLVDAFMLYFAECYDRGSGGTR